jgi:hypothetical protein
MGFFDSVKGFFTQTASKASDFFNRSAQWVTKVAIPEIYKAATPIVNTLHQDAKDFLGGAKNFYGGIIDKVKGTVDNTVNKTTGVLSDLAWPLGIGVAVVGGIFLLKK